MAWQRTDSLSRRRLLETEPGKAGGKGKVEQQGRKGKEWVNRGARVDAEKGGQFAVNVRHLLRLPNPHLRLQLPPLVSNSMNSFLLFLAVWILKTLLLAGQTRTLFYVPPPHDFPIFIILPLLTCLRTLSAFLPPLFLFSIFFSFFLQIRSRKILERLPSHSLSTLLCKFYLEMSYYVTSFILPIL